MKNSKTVSAKCDDSASARRGSSERLYKVEKHLSLVHTCLSEASAPGAATRNVKIVFAWEMYRTNQAGFGKVGERRGGGLYAVKSPSQPLADRPLGRPRDGNRDQAAD